VSEASKIVEWVDVRDMPFNACCYRDRCASDRAQIARLTEQVRVAREAMQDADRRLSRPDWTVQRDTVRNKLRETLTLMEKNDD
jgi:hypothetical protein